MERRVGFLCPHDEHIITSVAEEDEVPETVECLPCEAEGRDPTHQRSELGRLSYYRLAESRNG